MGAYYDEIEIEDMVWDEEKAVYHYPCPCGDRFEISRRQLANYEDIATCPSCSLVIRVVYDPVRLSQFIFDSMTGPSRSCLNSLISRTNRQMTKRRLQRVRRMVRSQTARMMSSRMPLRSSISLTPSLL
ncbi:zf-CSL-domain-containing protein [Leucogyrophana mollusca]|uniref:Zf-CSL-domain-containing protein n=1 Tax=Leucogyrophana mollusca TaxID=85980 RepID=A0ACB8BH53_9AGAM|nr:zf-CSL-domain-containing protein [Leucogyrophana mollusca]